METKRYKNGICIIFAACLLCMLFFLMSMADSNSVPANSGLSSKDLSVNAIKYPKTLFDDSEVHTIDIQVDDRIWGNMIENAQYEQYIPCTMIIDGVRINEVGIRPKGDTSLKQVMDMNSQNFCFKVEFDHYKNQSFDGLDKMILNSCSQDTTYIKDYLAQHMMNYMGIAAPLSSYVNITLNGKDFGFYLAMEAVEKSFCVRNYGVIDAKLYKPDALELPKYDYIKIMGYETEDGQSAVEYLANAMSGSAYKDFNSGTRVDMLGDMAKVLIDSNEINTDVTGLTYIDNNPKSYKAILNSGVFSVDESDEGRLINSIKKLNSGEDLDNTVDVDSVIKYFVVHNFVDNYDGYTSIFSHNYYLCERGGKLSMIPWDYNLAFGSFAVDPGNSSSNLFGNYIKTSEARYGMSSTKSMVNYPINTPVFKAELEKRPMINQILKNSKYSDKYHQYFEKFINDYFNSGYFDKFYESTVDIISPYIKNDKKGFFTYNQFVEGAKELNKFCKLRAKSVQGQLTDTVPSTLNGQKEHPETLIDTQDLDMTKTITMYSILGISNKDMDGVLKILMNYLPEEYKTDGKIDMSKFKSSEDITYLKKIFGVMGPIAFEVSKSTKASDNKEIDTELSKILLILSLIAIIIFTILLSKYSRVKYKKRRVRRGSFEITS
ncbi:CotH kinase family protein [Ruminiclostridium papyrosolvens]|uniref:Spore coat protein CotH n=1 Tax=Ruminiclostridium papyrosolvens C7 TaxID=1330534 RepID=U4QZ99_9FIRM|nr:CotH kinase family protein [Ruminiclostridium papyrosolvens]EPR09325.1 spore coat protein CotH [Ruminiclostridium papyrosolvens C7]